MITVPAGVRIGDYPINRLNELLPWNIAGQATRSLAA
jgi:hypothetical protein